MSNNEDKLPKWAQLELSRLRGVVTTLQEQLAALQPAERRKSNVSMLDGMDELFLPADSIVCFYVGAARRRVRVQVRGDVLDVNANDCVSVIPRASNSVHVRPYHELVEKLLPKQIGG